MSTQAEILVIGGGPAGAAVAARLAGAGREVVLIEREREARDKVCGEFLSWETLGELSDLGVQPDLLAAVPISTVALSSGDRIAEAPLPQAAASLSRRSLDEALLTMARTAGAQLRRGRRVSALESHAGGWIARLAGGGEVAARHVFLATGKHDLRDWKRPAGLQADLVAFKMHWRLDPHEAAALAGRVELYLFPGGYAGLEPIEKGLANLCLLVRRDRLDGADDPWPGLLARMRGDNPLLDRRLTGAAPCNERPLAAAALPYGFVARSARGVWRVGDQAAVIPSFAGEGLAIALCSARLAARAFMVGEAADAFQLQLHRALSPRVRRASRLSQALVRPAAQAILSTAVRYRPDLLIWAARNTRIPSSVSAGSSRGPEGSGHLGAA